MKPLSLIGNLSTWFIILFGVGVYSHVAAEIPAWAKTGASHKNGNILTIVCDGIGPSISLARKESISNCQVSARQFLGDEIKIKTLSVETEHSVGFHQEVEENSLVRNLVCNPKKDAAFEKDGQTQVWTQCEFDLSKVQMAPKPITQTHEDLKANSGLATVSPAAIKSESEFRNLFVETVPQCDSILLQGEKSRVIPCKSNPLRIALEDNDKVMIVSARGYQPKTIHITKGTTNENIQIFLERN